MYYTKLSEEIGCDTRANALVLMREDYAVDGKHLVNPPNLRWVTPPHLGWATPRIYGGADACEIGCPPTNSSGVSLVFACRECACASMTLCFFDVSRPFSYHDETPSCHLPHVCHPSHHVLNPPPLHPPNSTSARTPPHPFKRSRTHPHRPRFRRSHNGNAPNPPKPRSLALQVPHVGGELWRQLLHRKSHRV